MQEIEIIVVNDGSTDSTPEIVNSFKDPRLIIVNKVNGGLSSARRAGLAQAKGEYIYQLDGDDWVEKDAIFDMYQLASAQDLDIVIADAYVDDDEGGVLYFNGVTSLSSDVFQDILLTKITPNFWTKLIRKKVYTDNEIFYNDKIAIGEDILVNVQLLFYTKKVGMIKKAYLHYIQRKTSISKVYNEKMYQIFDVFKELKLFLEKNNIHEKYRQEFECLEYIHTYFFRILVDVKDTKIQKDFYDRGQKKYAEYLNNPFVITFLETRNKGERKLEKIFRINYYLGRFRLKIIKYTDKIRNR